MTITRETPHTDTTEMTLQDNHTQENEDRMRVGVDPHRRATNLVTVQERRLGTQEMAHIHLGSTMRPESLKLHKREQRTLKESN